jgi:hypothetical protein
VRVDRRESPSGPVTHAPRSRQHAAGETRSAELRRLSRQEGQASAQAIQLFVAAEQSGVESHVGSVHEAVHVSQPLDSVGPPATQKIEPVHIVVHMPPVLHAQASKSLRNAVYPVSWLVAQHEMHALDAIVRHAASADAPAAPALPAAPPAPDAPALPPEPRMDAHGVVQSFVTQVRNATRSVFESHEVSVVPRQLSHVVSATHAIAWAQQVVSMHVSHVGTWLVTPQLIGAPATPAAPDVPALPLALPPAPLLPPLLKPAPPLPPVLPACPPVVVA